MISILVWFILAVPVAMIVVTAVWALCMLGAWADMVQDKEE